MRLSSRHIPPPRFLSRRCSVGRGVVGPVAAQLVAQFADCIAKQLQSPAATLAEDVPAEVKPVGGFGLFFRSLIGIFRRRR